MNIAVAARAGCEYREALADLSWSWDAKKGIPLIARYCAGPQRANGRDLRQRNAHEEPGPQLMPLSMTIVDYLQAL